jgi:malate synthase
MFQDRALNAFVFDVAVFAYLNAQKLVERGETIALYIPKLESADEAKLVNNILSTIEKVLFLPENSIRVTILCETYPLIFELEAALRELKNRALGINFGRYDYIFSMIKKLGKNMVFPSKSAMNMSAPFLVACATRIVRICKEHGAQPIGGMSAYLPVKGNPIDNAIATAQIKRDKFRELDQGFIGAWIAHPGLKDLVKDIFANKDPYEYGKRTFETDIDFLPEDTLTYGELCSDISTLIEYMYHWCLGKGAVAINNKMEDLATAEITRVLLSNWLLHNARLDGEPMDAELFEIITDQEEKKLLETKRFSDEHMLNWVASHLVFTFARSLEAPFISEVIAG